MIGIVLSMGYGQATAHPIDIGIVKIDSKNEWRLYTARKMRQGDGVIIQIPKGNDVVCCVKATPYSGREKQVETIVTDEFRDDEVWSYKLKPFLPTSKTRPFVGIAVVGDVAYARRDGNLIRSLNGDNEIVVSSCLGSEGVHVLARTGTKVQAHLYLNLGYSITANCTEEMLE